MDILLLDGYTDEPAVLGVPPYIAPLPRYLVGAIQDAGLEPPTYLTIEQLRSRGPRGKGRRRGEGRWTMDWGTVRQRLSLMGEGGWDLLVLVGGAIVPGRYMRGRPASMRELAELASSFPGTTVLVGPVGRYGWTSGKAATEAHMAAFDHVAERDGDAYVFDLLSEGRAPRNRTRTAEEWSRWPVLGAPLVSEHPDHPRPLIAEVETYRGCVRHASGGCSFCTTVRDMPPTFRAAEDVEREVAALYGAGVVALRLGGQSCIYSYKARDVGGSDAPTPDPSAVRGLFAGVRRAAPDLEVLHVDNANPAVIAEHPEEAREVTRVLVDHCTGGNVVALGLESADPAVTAANNLNATPKQCLEAIRLINDVGGTPTESGLPALLPGVNFLAGLWGETAATFDMDMAFLRQVHEEGLLLRRINIRQVASVCADFDTRANHKAFRDFRERVRRDIDLPMLERLLPFGSLLKDVWLEVHDGNTTFGRQVGSYPLTVGISAPLELGRFLDVRVVSHGPRSVTAVPAPLDLNAAPMSILASIPGINKKRAARIVRARPIEDAQALEDALDDPVVVERLLPLVW